MTGANYQGLRNTAITSAFLALVMLLGAVDLAAQILDSAEQFDKVYPFIGNWGVDYSPEGQDRGNCAGRLGDAGEKLQNCQLPADQLPLNARARAWLEFMDHRASPTLNDCAPGVIPSLLGDSGRWFLSGRGDQIIINYADGPGWTRHIWMDGRSHPRPEHLFQHGHSIGRWDGDDLVVETTNFTFDPDGIDDHLHLASSVLKKVTERYHLIDDETMRLTITIEDPVFLTRPFRYALIENKKPGGLTPGWWHCDPEAARREVEYGYAGNKYPDDDTKK